MSKNKTKYVIIANLYSIVIAIIIIIFILGMIKILFGTQIETAFMLANKVSINVDSNKDNTNQETKIDTEKKTLENYPEYGTQYATIEIPRIDANLPVYFGDTLEILKKGVGHSSGSYFPGEGGSILYMGHNSKKVFRRFSELQIGDEIKVTTTYGEYNYKIYDMQLINETELEKVPIQKDEEMSF